MAELKAALLDIDGTLIDSNQLHVQAWVEAFESLGHPVPGERIAGLIGMGGDKLVPELWPDANEAMCKDADARHGEIFKRRYLAEAKPFPHARDLVARIYESGMKVVLATSGSDEEVGHYIDLLGIARFVVAKTTSDEVKASKPAPDIFAAALAKAELPGEAAIAIGDSPYDVAGASRSGVRTIALLSGGFPRERLADAVAIYDDVADLLARYDASPLVR